jgi:hypothetical protein
MENGVCFPDAVIKCPSNCLNDLNDDACLFIDVVVDGKTFKRTEQLTKESAAPTWRLDGNIQV